MTQIIQGLVDSYDLENIDLPGIEKAFKEQHLGTLLYYELQTEIRHEESLAVNEEISKLTKENLDFGGSVEGYYHDGELYVDVSVEQEVYMANVKPIDFNLYQRAEAVRLNREEIAQNLTSIAVCISVLNNVSENVYQLVANLPEELSKFSNIIKQVVNSQSVDPAWRESNTFDREDKKYATFFQHFQNIEPMLKRFLFRRITR